MNHPEPGRGKNLVIFDRFYKNPAFDEGHDTISGVLGNRHNVLANANNLSAAVETLIAIKKDELATPDVIVTGGLLEGELDYENNPPVVTTTETRMGRGLRGRKERTVEIRRFALPIADTEGSIYLPPVGPRGIGDSMRNAQLFREGLARTGRQMVLSGFVIAHLSKELLGDRGIKVIGHSSFTSFGDNVPVDAYVNKQEYARPLWLAEEIETA